MYRIIFRDADGEETYSTPHSGTFEATKLAAQEGLTSHKAATFMILNEDSGRQVWPPLPPEREAS